MRSVYLLQAKQLDFNQLVHSVHSWYNVEAQKCEFCFRVMIVKK